MSRLGLTSAIVLACGLLMGAASWGSAAARAGASPGKVPLNATGEVDSISCAAAGECAAGGFYRSGFRQTQAFVLSETSGRWGKPIEVPGTAALNGGGHAEADSVSCAAAGECVAGGYYTGKGGQQVFVVSETNGRWGKAIEVPGTATLNVGGLASVDSVSCAAVGECAVGGFYHASDGGQRQAFLVSETSGSWGTAVEVPGMTKLKGGTKGAGVDSISCAAPGDCSAGGEYGSTNNPPKAFVASETNGIWGDAIEVPGTDTDNIGGATLNSVSCGGIGECVAGGSYYVAFAGDYRREAFVVTETDGLWGTAVEVPGIRTLNTYGDAHVNSISCAAAGDCAVGGYYNGCCSFPDEAAGSQAFVANETDGTWGNAIEVPGTAPPASVPYAYGSVVSISCAAPGDCAAGGYSNASGDYPNGSFVVEATNGRWGEAFKEPGAFVDSISCPAVGECAGAGISYRGYSEDSFVVSEQNGTWGRPTPVFPAACVVPNVIGKRLDTAKRKLGDSACGVGKITRAYSTAKKGRITAQRPKPAQVLKVGARVALTLSKGEKTS